MRQAIFDWRQTVPYGLNFIAHTQKKKEIYTNVKYDKLLTLGMLFKNSAIE